MKLNEAIISQMGKKVKIGSGSGFVFIDTIDENTLSEISKISKDYFKRLKEYYNQTYTFYENLDSRWNARRKKAYDDYIKKTALHEAQRPLHKILEEIDKEKEAEREKTERDLRKTRKKIENYKPFGDGEVKETYDCLYADLVIIFEGTESGDFWLEEEYKARKGKK